MTTDPFARLRRFLAELKRRNVYQVVATYAVVGFVLIQVADLTFVRLGLPAWTVTLVIVLVATGFPLALVLAWAFERTPEGMRRTSEPEPAEGKAAGTPGDVRTGYKVLVGLGLVAAVVAGGWYLTGGTSGSDGPTVVDDEELDSSRVAVFPFTIRTGEDMGHWSEGMVELMGRSLNGAGSLTSVDPNTLLSRVEARPGERLPEDRARRVAARFGAGVYVLGAVYRLGDSVRLSATWYRADGKRIGSDEVTGASEAEIQAMVDAVSRSAIADLAGEGEARRRRLAAQTTASTDALKAYLAGQRAFRNAEWSEAITSFSMAVEQDSSFALAHYRLGLSRAWSGRDLVAAHRALRRAVERSGNLPERDRRFLRAAHAFQTGDAERAEQLYRRLVQTHPTDAEAWYMLGEVLFHHNAVRRRSLTESREPFRRARELNPTFSDPLVHLVHLALLEGDTARLDSLTREFGAEQRLPYGIDVVLRVARDRADTVTPRSAFRPMLQGEPANGLVGAHALSMWNTESGYEAADLWTKRDRPAELRAIALLMQTDLLTEQGRLQAAQRKIDSLARVDSAAHWTARGYMAVLPYLSDTEVPVRERENLLQELGSWNADSVPERTTLLYLSPPEVYPAGRLYLLGLLRARGGEYEEARRAAGRLEAMEPSVLAPSAPADFARSIRAEMARLQDDPGTALRHYEAMRHRVDPLLLLVRLHSYARERFLRAELLAEQGRLQEAQRWYRTLTGLSWGERLYRAPAHLGQARVLGEMGRSEEAVRHYRRVLEIWSDADSVLQPRVEMARKRVKELTGSGAKPDG